MLRIWKSLCTRLAGDARPERPPLRILRLERRRLLSADFALAATGLVLDGFDGARDLSISEADGEYLFTLDEGEWRAADDQAAPDGVRVDGDTLAVDKLAVDPLADGVTVVAPSDALSFNVSFEGVDFADLSGALTLDGVTSINDPSAGLEVAALSAGPLVASPAITGPPALTLNSMNFAGDLNLIFNGAIIDAPGTTITVGGDLNIISRPSGGVAGIELANEAGDMLSVAGVARFEAQSADASTRFDIHVGNFSENTAEFGSLSVFGGKATVSEADATVIDNSDVTSLDVTSRGSITDTGATGVEVADNARFTAANGNAITLDDVHNFGTLTFDGGAVQIVEASSTELAGTNSATTLDLDSAGEITDEAGTINDVGGLADFASTTGDDITLDETHRFGSLRFTGGAVAITEADGTELSGVSLADSLALQSGGAITDDGAADVTVIGLASFNSLNDVAITLDDTYNFGSLKFDGGDVSIFEASGTVLSGASDSATLALTSNGSITDDGTAAVNVAGLAFFDSTPDAAITLDDTYTFGQLRFDGGTVAISEADGTELAGVSDASTLSLTSAGAITDAVGAELTVANQAFFDSTPDADITLDAAVLEFGSLRFDGGAVTIAETDATVLSGASEAATLALTSDGSITDDGTADVTVAGNAAFESTPDAAITLDDNYNFGSLTFDGGAVAILEQSGTVLSGASEAATLDLDSLGAISDDGTAVVDVAGLADFAAVAGGDITLDDTYTFGTLTFSGGVVTIFEAAGGTAAGTVLVGASLAASLVLRSDGPITDDGTANLLVFGNASFDSTTDGAITLDDTYNFGTLTLDGGVVTIVEQSATVLTGENSATDLSLESINGSITDTATTETEVTGPAVFRAADSIVLADAGSDNSLEIDGFGQFFAGVGREIAIGVTPPTGDPADALATIGTLRFNVVDGNARVALDGNVTLQDTSIAADIELNAFGDDFDITDEPNADVTFTRTAILRAAGDDIIVGDVAGSRFGMDADPTVFDTDEFLALEAANVSIVADTGINLRTGPEETPFSGSFFLRAAGTLAQVQGPATDFNEPVLSGLTPLTANRVALASDDGAVLFSQITLTENDGETPDLAIEAGGSESFAAVIDGRIEFPTVDIAGGADGEFLPIDLAIDAAAEEFEDDDPNGLELLPGEQIIENGAEDELGNLQTPDTIGDRFSIVAVVNGDASIGVVSDATTTRADLLGVMVTDAEGNTFLRTLEDVGGGEAGNLRFTSQGATSETVVVTQGGVFTAIAAGLLTIETDAPDVRFEDLDPGEITTLLTSSTGTVSSVAEFTTLLGVPLELAPGLPIDPDADLITLSLVGPRFILDPPSNDLDAATSDQVRTEEIGGEVIGEQRVTFAVGSRGEEGVLVELEWANANVRRESPLDVLPITLAPNGEFPGPSLPGDVFDPLNDTRVNPLDLNTTVDGTIPLAEVTVTVDAATFEALEASGAVVQLSDPALDFRVVTVTHEFTQEFLQSYLDVDVFEGGVVRAVLPTTIRVYNDPLINLYDQGGERSLNENANFLEPDIGQQPGFSEPTPAIVTSAFPIVEQPLVVAPIFAAPSPASDVDLQASVSSDVEVIQFGRIDKGAVDADGDELIDATGEPVLFTWDGPDRDFIEKIRQLVDDGAFSEGEYRIITKSPRGEQQLEVWTKGDSEPEQAIDTEEDENAEDSPARADEQADIAAPMAPVSAAAVPTADPIVIGGPELVREVPPFAWSSIDVNGDTARDGDAQRLGLAAIGGAGLALTRRGLALEREHHRAARRRRKLRRSLAEASASGKTDSPRRPEAPR